VLLGTGRLAVTGASLDHSTTSHTPRDLVTARDVAEAVHVLTRHLRSSLTMQRLGSPSFSSLSSLVGIVRSVVSAFLTLFPPS
jgi:hypothetical protein